MNLIVSALFVLVSAAGPAPHVSNAAQDRPQDASASEATRPGPQHLMLQKLTGNWDAVVITRDPKGAEVRTNGRMTTTRQTDFHTVDNFQGEVMGMPVVGHGVNGYCTVRRQFFTFWTDSMSASPMTLYGEFDAEKRELRLSGECLAPSGRLERCRTVTRYVDDDHTSWALYGAGPDGKETLHLRIEYTRRK